MPTMAEAQRVETVGSLVAVGVPEWERLAAGRGLYLSHEWLQTIERDRALQPQYTLARGSDGVLEAAMPSYLWDGAGGWTTSTYDVTWPVSKLLGDAGVQRDEWFPTLLVGGRTGYVNEPVGLSPGGSSAVIARSFELAGELGARSAAAMYLTRRGADEVVETIDGIVTLLWGVGTAMDVEWDGFEGYVASLNAHRRTTVKRDLARFAAGEAVVTVEPLSEQMPEAARLALNVQRRYGTCDTLDGVEEYLGALVEELDARTRVFAARRGAELLGFGLAFEFERCLYMRLVGFDYERMGDESVYFEVCYYAPIRYAAERGLAAIDFGAASLRPKLLRGARPSPRFVAVVPPEVCRDAVEAAVGEWNEGAFAWFNTEIEPFAGALPRAEWMPRGADGSS